MSVIAGAVVLEGSEGIPSEIRDGIRRHISRSTRDPVAEFEAENCFLAKVDPGIFGAPAALRDAAGNVSLLAGEPLLGNGDTVGDRAMDLASLHDEWVRGNWSGLSRCTGTFCAVHFNAGSRSVSLISDKIGLRPIYYYTGDGLAVYATALRVLEQIRSLSLEIDLRGLTEIAVFGFPLAQRTAYSNISTIDAGQIVQLSRGGIRKSHYWRWDEAPPLNKDISEVAKEAHAAFRSAVARRVRGDRAVAAYLSGGLDSRSIVSTLVDQGVEVHTLNFAVEGSQDYVFARGASVALGTRFRELTMDLPAMYAFRGRSYNQQQASRLFDSHPDFMPLRRMIWSGDGGSVGVGHVYLNEDIARHAASGNVEAAIDAFMAYNKPGLNLRLFKPEVRDTLSRIPRKGIQEEIARLNCADQGRAFHLFLMLNDQRRHLANVFENVDLDRIEFQLPFFDSDFLALILRSPLDGFLRHEFYMKWLSHFSPGTLSVPWQAYPGHVQCPLPAPSGLRYQWGDLFSRRQVREMNRGLVKEIDGYLGSAYFPDRIMDRRMLRVASWLTRSGLRDCGYLLKTASIYCRYAGGGERATS